MRPYLCYVVTNHRRMVRNCVAEYAFFLVTGVAVYPHKLVAKLVPSILNVLSAGQYRAPILDSHRLLEFARIAVSLQIRLAS